MNPDAAVGRAMRERSERRHREMQATAGQEVTCSARLQFAEPGLTFGSWWCERPVEHPGAHEVHVDPDDGFEVLGVARVAVLLRWDDADGVRGLEL